MKIEDPKAEPTNLFGNIKVGATFRWGVSIWMRVVSNKPDEWNAVNLKTGDVSNISEMAEVVPVNAKLVVES